MRPSHGGDDVPALRVEDRFTRAVGLPPMGYLQRVPDNDADYVTAQDMLGELHDDNRELAARMRETHALCDEHGDVASASLLEVWIDEAEQRSWFLYEASRRE
jgi:starvation-inducible DNA-binding protein